MSLAAFFYGVNYSVTIKLTMVKNPLVNFPHATATYGSANNRRWKRAERQRSARPTLWQPSSGQQWSHKQRIGSRRPQTGHRRCHQPASFAVLIGLQSFL